MPWRDPTHVQVLSGILRPVSRIDESAYEAGAAHQLAFEATFHRSPRSLGYVYLSGWEATPFTPVYERVSHDPAWQTFSLPVGHDVIAEAFDPLLEIALRFTS